MALGDSVLSGLNTLRDSISKSERGVSDPRTIDILLAENVGLSGVRKSEREPYRYGGLYCPQTIASFEKGEQSSLAGMIDDRQGNLMTSGLLM
jgi:hypothetical protein